jgi:hypothetical protein
MLSLRLALATVTVTTCTIASAQELRLGSPPSDFVKVLGEGHRTTGTQDYEPDFTLSYRPCASEAVRFQAARWRLEVVFNKGRATAIRGRACDWTRPYTSDQIWNELAVFMPDDWKGTRPSQLHALDVIYFTSDTLAATIPPEVFLWHGSRPREPGMFYLVVGSRMMEWWTSLGHHFN